MSLPFFGMYYTPVIVARVEVILSRYERFCSALELLVQLLVHTSICTLDASSARQILQRVGSALMPLI